MALAAPRLLSVSYNQDGSCVAVGTDCGFRIYSATPFRETFRRDFGGAAGGVGAVEMLFRCNILALVGGGAAPKYPPSKVMIWDDHQGRCIGELGFRSEVRAVRLRRERLAVALEHKVYVYNFGDLKLQHATETAPNPLGLLALSPAPGAAVLACPGLHRGGVRLEWYDATDGGSAAAAGGASAAGTGGRRTRFVSAHDGALAALALSADGARLATASDKGTLVRVFDTASGAPLAELRRGADRATIFSIAFSTPPPPAAGAKGGASAPAMWLAASSDKGTVHVWPLPPPGPVDAATAAAAAAAAAQPQQPPGGSGGKVGFMKGLLPKYFSSAWSHAQLRLPAGAGGAGGGASAASASAAPAAASVATPAPRSVVAFGAEPHTLLVAVTDGTFHRASFDPASPGECTGAEFARFLDAEGEPEAGDAAASALDALSLGALAPPTAAAAAAPELAAGAAAEANANA